MVVEHPYSDVELAIADEERPLYVLLNYEIVVLDFECRLRLARRLLLFQLLDSRLVLSELLGVEVGNVHLEELFQVFRRRLLILR